MTLAETLQIKHFQLSSEPELKANSCAPQSLPLFSLTYFQPYSAVLLLLPLPLTSSTPPFALFTSEFLSRRASELVSLAPLSAVFANFFVLLVLPSLVIFLHTNELTELLCFCKTNTNNTYFFVFYYSPLCFPSPSSCCLMGGTPHSTKTLCTTSSNIMATLN